MTTEQKEILALLMIGKGGSFANSYGLCKILAWKFAIIDCSEIIKNLDEKKFITYNMTEGVKHFNLTGEGLKAIERDKPSLIELLKKDYKEEIEIIERL